MKAKDVAKLIALISAFYHAAAIARDAQRCKVNLDRYLAVPSGENLFRLALAAGVLASDF